MTALVINVFKTRGTEDDRIYRSMYKHTALPISAFGGCVLWSVGGGRAQP